MPKVPSVDAPYIGASHQGGSQDPTLNVIHATVGPTKAGSARAVAAMWHNKATSPISSAHYPIDSAEVVQCVFDHKEAYHCGYNADSLAYEMCFMPLLSSLANWLLPKRQRPVVQHKAAVTPLQWLRPDVRAMMDRTALAVAQNSLHYGIPIRFLGVKDVLAWDRAGRPARLGGITTHAVMSKAFKRSTHWDPGAWPRRLFMRRVHFHARQLQR